MEWVILDHKMIKKKKSQLLSNGDEKKNELGFPDERKNFKDRYLIVSYLNIDHLEY